VLAAAARCATNRTAHAKKTVRTAVFSAFTASFHIGLRIRLSRIACGLSTTSALTREKICTDNVCIFF
jgi:hypothetical protein